MTAGALRGRVRVTKRVAVTGSTTAEELTVLRLVVREYLANLAADVGDTRTDQLWGD
jgi:hypothetical protein